LLDIINDNIFIPPHYIMSTAFYPTNMRQQPAGGYNSRSTLQDKAYITWKGTGYFSNPVSVTATHIRPLTNNDPGNVFPTGFGMPRPIKHYRKGKGIYSNGVGVSQAIEYNLNRAVKSSMGQSLGGGNGGSGLLAQTMEFPGAFVVKENGSSPATSTIGLANIVETDSQGKKIDADCKTCDGVGMVSGWYPINNLTEKPEPNVTNPLLCCNQQRKAIQRVLPTNTNVKKNYFQTTYMYLYNRCQTFQQRQFNFLVENQLSTLLLNNPEISAQLLSTVKPGDPLSITNYYVAQCNPSGTIKEGAVIAFIHSLLLLLLHMTYITKDMYDKLIQTDSKTLESFVKELQSVLNKDQYNQVVEYLYKLAANPYNGDATVLSGANNPKSCAKVIYKPNNPQFAQQGGVASSTRMLKLNVDTISTAAANQKSIYSKDKVDTGCQAQTYSGNPFFFSGQHQNKNICNISKSTGQVPFNTYNSVKMHSAGNYIGATQHA